MLVGPVFTREAISVPRRLRLYLARAGYVAVLLLLMVVAYWILTGTQQVTTIGMMARFGAILFQILAPLQLAMATVFSALLAAAAVAQEKDRRTLILLLLTNLTNSELVLGKLLASLLMVLTMLAAALPLFMLAALFGGVSFEQIANCFLVTLASALAAGSLGSTLALWREKTFQALALTFLGLVFWLALWEVVATGALGEGWAGVTSATWAACLSPWQAIQAATRPSIQPASDLGWQPNPVFGFILIAFAGAAIFNLIAILLVRVWNPSREVQPREATVEEADAEHAKPGAARSVHSAPGKTRDVWDNPILWRETQTWAYGRRVLVIRIGYLLMFAAAAWLLHNTLAGEVTRSSPAIGVLPTAAKPLLPLMVLSLVLVNALAVTAITTERDSGAIDLLLVTDLTPKEIIFGKLGGVFFITKEMVLLPMALCVLLWFHYRAISAENLAYLLVGLAVMYVFVAMLGIHAGMMYTNSRSAIGVSLGTVMFLFFGVATCMQMLLAFSGSFTVQLGPFLAFSVGGGIGLFVALGARNPSPALALASFGAPFFTFYAVTSFLLGSTLAVFIVISLTYAFATAAMMIPAIYEFDVATGRTTAGDE